MPISEEKKFNYQMLSRLKSDCDYFLNYGNRSQRVLWEDDVKAHIKKMKTIWNSFTNNEKPEWLTYQEIEKYEIDMSD